MRGEAFFGGVLARQAHVAIRQPLLRLGVSLCTRCNSADRNTKCLNETLADWQAGT